jgi:adenylate kinase
VAQAEVLQGLLKAHGQGLDAVVAVHVPHEELVRRLGGRLVCRSCGAMFHIEFNPPASLERCDACGGDLYQRDDDRPDRISVRLTVHEQQVSALEEFYRAVGLLHPVEGTGTPDDVFGRIKASLR